MSVAAMEPTMVLDDIRVDCSIALAVAKKFTLPPTNDAAKQERAILASGLGSSHGVDNLVHSQKEQTQPKTEPIEARIKGIASCCIDCRIWATWEEAS